MFNGLWFPLAQHVLHEDFCHSKMFSLLFKLKYLAGPWYVQDISKDGNQIATLKRLSSHKNRQKNSFR